MEFAVAILPGDGIGPEVVAEGLKVMEAVAHSFGHRFRFTEDVVGGAAIDRYGVAVRPETLEMAQKSAAILFGAVGGPKWDDPRAKVRPEDGILTLRKRLGLFANLRPVKVHPVLANASPVKAERLKGVDLVVVRELTGGLYFSRPKRRWQTARGKRAVDTLRYTQQEIDRILRVGFELARGRRKKLTSVDKANVLETSRLWRELATVMAKEYPDVILEHMLADTCAMQLVSNPGRFDVIVTENTFGDILTDEAAILAGSLGMLPSASLAGLPASGGRRRRALGLYEPIHGSAPDIAGQGKANPLATILSASLLLRYSLGLVREANVVEKAVAHVLKQGCRTADIARPGEKTISTAQMGAAVVDLVRSL